MTTTCVSPDSGNTSFLCGGMVTCALGYFIQQRPIAEQIKEQQGELRFQYPSQQYPRQ
jgi:hypothetical protein